MGLFDFFLPQQKKQNDYIKSVDDRLVRRKRDLSASEGDIVLRDEDFAPFQTQVAPVELLKPRPLITNPNSMTVSNTEPIVRPAAEPAPVIESERDKLVRRRNTLATEKPVDKNGRWKSAGYAALEGLGDAFSDGRPIRGWGDFATRAAAGAGGGLVGGAIAPNWDERRRNQIELQKVDTQIKGIDEEDERLIKRRKIQQEAVGSELENQGRVLGNRQKGLDILKTANKSLYDSITADDVVTAEEAKRATESGYPVQPYDARAFKTDAVGGVTFATPTKGIPKPQVVEGMPIDEEKTIKEITTSTGNKYRVTQPKALEYETAIATGDIQRATQILIANNKIANDNTQTANQYSTEQAKTLAERDAAVEIVTSTYNRKQELQGEIGGMEAQLKNIPEYETVNLGTDKKPKMQSRKNTAFTTIQNQIKAKRDELGNVEKNYIGAEKTAREKESYFNRLGKPKAQQTINEVPQLGPKNWKSKGGQNNRVGTQNDYRNALSRIK